MISKLLEEDLDLITWLATNADNGMWTCDLHENIVLLESGNSVTAKTEDGWQNNLKYIASIEPERVKRITGLILGQANVHREIAELARKASDLAESASEGPWIFDADKAAVVNGKGTSILSWVDFNDRPNCEYIAWCRPKVMLSLVSWIEVCRLSSTLRSAD